MSLLKNKEARTMYRALNKNKIFLELYKYTYLFIFVLSIIFTKNLHAQIPKNIDWKSFVIERIGDQPETNAIICIGSSHMEKWKTVKRDFDSLTVYNMGIGGTTMKDAVDKFAENLVIPYKPRAIILYEGSNDIAYGVTPVEILIQFVELYTKIHNALPCTRMYIVSIVPSPGERFEKWKEIQETNNLISKACSLNKLLTYIDITSGLLGEDSKPNMEYFIPGDIHMTDIGYDVWRKTIIPTVTKIEKIFE